MKRYHMCISMNGYADIDANSEEEAKAKVLELSYEDFDWESFSQEVLEDACILSVHEV